MSEETQKILFDAAGKPTHIDGLALRDDEAENIAGILAEGGPQMADQLSAAVLVRMRAAYDLGAVEDGGRKIATLTLALGKSPATEAKEILASLNDIHGKAIVRYHKTLKECALYGVDVLTGGCPVLVQAEFPRQARANPLEKFKEEIAQFVEEVRPMVDDLKATFDESNQLESLFNCLRSLEVVRRLRSADLNPEPKGLFKSKKADAKDGKEDADTSHDHIDLQNIDCFLQNEANRLAAAMLPDDEPEVPAETAKDAASDIDPTIERDPTAEA